MVESLEGRTYMHAVRSLSGIVYCDDNNNGKFDSGEDTHAGVTVTLTGTLTAFNNQPFSATTTTGSDGKYSFDHLYGGVYKLKISNRPAGSSDATDPAGNVSPGSPTPNAGGGIISNIVLDANHPFTGVNGTADFKGFNFGLHCPIPFIPMCCEPSSKSGGMSDFAGGVSTSTDSSGNIQVTYDQFQALNDNSYGVNSVGWNNKQHKFQDLTGSDHAEFVFKDKAGNVVLDFYMDYISAVSGGIKAPKAPKGGSPSPTPTITAPSGYASLGPYGGDGKLVSGNLANLIGFTSSEADNLNYFATHGGLTQNGVNLTVDSPPADANYNVANPAFAAWNFHNSYSVKISANAFAAGGGFGSVTIQNAHNSPQKKTCDISKLHECPPGTALPPLYSNGKGNGASTGSTGPSPF